MARYIDDRYIEATMFCILPMQQITTKEIEIKSYKRGWNDALNAILRNAPTADVRENVRARWTYGENNTLVCSNCGNSVSFTAIDGGWTLGRFCQTCGADMRGEKNGEQ